MGRHKLTAGLVPISAVAPKEWLEMECERINAIPGRKARIIKGRLYANPFPDDDRPEKSGGREKKNAKRVCKTCGKEFLLGERKAATGDYCSWGCRYPGKTSARMKRQYRKTKATTESSSSTKKNTRGRPVRDMTQNKPRGPHSCLEVALGVVLLKKKRLAAELTEIDSVSLTIEGLIREENARLFDPPRKA